MNTDTITDTFLSIKSTLDKIESSKEEYYFKNEEEKTFNILKYNFQNVYQNKSLNYFKLLKVKKKYTSTAKDLLKKHKSKIIKIIIFTVSITLKDIEVLLEELFIKEKEDSDLLENLFKLKDFLQSLVYICEILYLNDYMDIKDIFFISKFFFRHFMERKIIEHLQKKYYFIIAFPFNLFSKIYYTKPEITQNRGKVSEQYENIVYEYLEYINKENNFIDGITNEIKEKIYNDFFSFFSKIYSESNQNIPDKLIDYISPYGVSSFTSKTLNKHIKRIGAALLNIDEKEEHKTALEDLLSMGNQIQGLRGLFKIRDEFEIRRGYNFFNKQQNIKYRLYNIDKVYSNNLAFFFPVNFKKAKEGQSMKLKFIFEFKNDSPTVFSFNMILKKKQPNEETSDNKIQSNADEDSPNRERDVVYEVDYTENQSLKKYFTFLFMGTKLTIYERKGTSPDSETDTSVDAEGEGKHLFKSVLTSEHLAFNWKDYVHCTLKIHGNESHSRAVGEVGSIINFFISDDQITYEKELIDSEEKVRRRKRAIDNYMNELYKAKGKYEDQIKQIIKSRLKKSISIISPREFLFLPDKLYKSLNDFRGLKNFKIKVKKEEGSISADRPISLKNLIFENSLFVSDFLSFDGLNYLSLHYEYYFQLYHRYILKMEDKNKQKEIIDLM
ncbi:MAG: hypothetical protein MJ252_02560 [archaeon]|nr:hypothetical protein [archaeon]